MNIPHVLLPVRQQCLAERDGGGARGAGEGISEWLPEAMGDVERRRRRRRAWVACLNTNHYIK